MIKYGEFICIEKAYMIQCVRDDEKAIGVACISSTTASNDTVMEKM